MITDKTIEDIFYKYVGDPVGEYAFDYNYYTLQAVDATSEEELIQIAKSIKAIHNEE